MHQTLDHHLIVSRGVLSKKLDDDTIAKIITELIKIEKKFPSKSHLLIIDAFAAAGINHLKGCILLALKAFSQKNNIAKSLNTEILLYLSGYRQISKAIKQVGLAKTTKEILAIQLTSNDKENDFFNFQKFFNNFDIKFEKYFSDIENFHLSDYKKIKQNLNIHEKEIEVFLRKNEDSKANAIELLAMEKSTLLNLYK